MGSVFGHRQISLFPYLLLRVLPVAAIILAVIGFVGLAITQDIAEEKADELLERQSRYTRTIIQFRVSNIISQTRSLSQSALFVNGLIDVEGRRNYLPAFFDTLRLADFPHAKIELTDYKGRRLFSNQDEDEVHPESKKWRKEAVDKGIERSLLTVDGLFVASPVFYLGKAEGTVAVELGRVELPGLFDVGPQYNETVITDPEGRVIYASNSKFGTVGKPFANDGHRNRRMVSVSLKGFPGVEIRTLQWQDVALASQQWLKNFLIAGMLITLLVLGIAIALTAFIAKQNVFRLSSVVRKIGGANDMGQRVTPSGPAELYALGNDFNAMLETLQKTTTSYEYVDSIVTNTADGIITIDNFGLIETVNPAAEEMFGYFSEEVIGNNIAMLMPADERDAHDGYVRNSEIFVPRTINKAGELHGLRKDGILFPMELNVAPMQVGGDKKFIGLFRDITERMKVDKAKSEFVSTVSHELRTPLTSIRGSLALVKSGTFGELPEQVARLVELADNNTKRLIALVNDLLDMERLQSGEMEFHMDKVSLVEIVSNSIEANKPFADEHKVFFKLTETLPNAFVKGDSDRLAQVMANLSSNAAKFSPEGETIEVSLGRGEEGFRVNVADHGPGVPDEFRDQVFDRFTQADSTDTRQKGGTGLGLNISRAIIEKHGGFIDFESVPDNGATFYFDLPEYG
ncbi:MAG: PAS domain S-box protein [Rhodospirillales bacterium]|nr:PAS domain S-box protein [Rhodospirillales bacterium]